MAVIIKNVLLSNESVDIFVDDNKITKIKRSAENDNLDEGSADNIVDASGKAILPGLMNAHTHSAMTLLRGYADDMDLHTWLTEKIWPLEAKITEEDVYWGARLAIIEMIRSGTTFFSDMYWHFNGTARAVKDSGIRAAIGTVFLDLYDEEQAKEQIELNKKSFVESKKYGNRLIFTLGPHSIYTVSEDSLKWVANFSEENELKIHFHLSETEKEVNDCIEKHKMRPVEYLERIGFLSSRLSCAHSVWLDDKEIDILARHNVSVISNPVSNMKLSVNKAFQYEKIKKAGINIMLGTDGNASNNNLSMIESMKTFALLSKLHTGPTVLPAHDAIACATTNCARYFDLPIGEIKEGKLADFILVDLNNIRLVPGYNLESDMVYSADSSCITDVVVDGKFLMKDGKIEGEEEVKKEFLKRAKDLILVLKT